MPAGYGVGGYSTGTGTSAGGIASPEGVDNESIGGGGVSPGEGPSNGGNVFSKIGNAVKGMVLGKGKTYNMAMNPNKVSYTQNFLQGNLPKGYTVSESGNTVYAPTTPTAKEFAENAFTGIDPNVAFRGAVAGIDPVTGMMWSGGTKGGALDQYTKSMMTPQRVEQNRSRTDKYAAQSRNALRSQKGKVGLTAEQREINRQESLFNLDLDGDGNIFSSTDDDGVVYGMSNKAIYDPSLPEAYRGIPSRYATGLPTTNAATGALGNVYGGQKTSEDRMLFNEAMELAMPGSFIVKGVNYAKDMLSPKQQAQEAMTDDSSLSDLSIDELIEKAKSQIAPYGNFEINDPVTSFSNMTPVERQNFRNLPKSEFPVTTIKPDDLATSSNFANFIDKDPYGNPMYSNNPIVGYQADGRTPIYADDPNANQVPYMNVYP